LTEAGPERGVGGERRLQDLDGDGATELGVNAAEDVGHAPATDEVADDVSACEQALIVSHVPPLNSLGGQTLTAYSGTLRVLSGMTLRALVAASAYCSLMTLTDSEEGDPEEVPVLQRIEYDTESVPTVSTVMVPVVVFASNWPEELFWKYPPETATV